MSIDPKKFGLSDSLVNAVNEALKGSQHKIDVAEPKGKITGADFKKLRGEDAKPDFLDLDKDGNKKEPMKHAAKHVKEEAEQVDELSKKTLGSYVTKASDKAATHTGAAAHYGSGGTGNNPAKMAVHQAIATKRRAGIQKAVDKLTKEESEQVDELSDKTIQSYREKSHRDPKPREKGRAMAFAKQTGIGAKIKATKEEVEMTEADDAVAKQLAAKKEAMKKQIQQKIAQKQMSAMQAKANKRLSTISASSHTDKEDEKEMKKGGKETIEVNPPLKEASDLPKSVVKKGHEIAKSLIKRRADVREPYAVGMATAKKSAGIKEDAEQVDELSKATMGSYIKKSSQDLKNIEAGREKNADYAKHVKTNRAQDNRTKGIGRAVSKLTKD